LMRVGTEQTSKYRGEASSRLTFTGTKGGRDFANRYQLLVSTKGDGPGLAQRFEFDFGWAIE
jgi:hypothetical protein